MKKIFTLLVLVLILNVTICFAQTTTIQFQWDASVQDIAGYMLYQTADRGQYDYNHPVKVIEANITTTTISDVPNGTYYWVIRAFDDQKRYSEDSNEIMTEINYDACPGAPTGFVVIKIERE